VGKAEGGYSARFSGKAKQKRRRLDPAALVHETKERAFNA
jgi:hypothetical protein